MGREVIADFTEDENGSHLSPKVLSYKARKHIGPESILILPKRQATFTKLSFIVKGVRRCSVVPILKCGVDGDEEF